MAIAKMRKVTATAATADRDKLLRLLIRSGAAEICDVECDKGKPFLCTEQKEELTVGLARLSFAFDFFKSQRNSAKKLVKKEVITYTAPHKSLLDPARPSVNEDEFASVYQNRQELFCVVERLEALNNEQLTLRTEEARLQNKRQQLSVYERINAPFAQFTDEKRLCFILGSISAEKSGGFDELAQRYPLAHFECDKEDVLSKQYALFVVCFSAQEQEILTALSEFDFMRCQFTSPNTAAEELAIIDSELKQKAEREVSLITDTLALDEYEPNLKTLFDYYSTELKKLEAGEHFVFTQSTFTLCCWVPANDVEKLYKSIDEAGVLVSIFDEDPREDEVVPTFAQNNSIIAPYESITNMYSVPSYREKDPNTVMAFFYFLLFGVMLGDAAYGIILALGAFIFYILKKPRKGEGKMLLVIGMGGISTAIWGFVFGSWFGEKLVPLYWFNPLEEPLLMLGLSLGLGFLQILVAMWLNAMNLFREKKPLDAIFNVFGWYVVFIGIGLYALAALVIKNAPPALSTAGLVVAIVGVVMLLVGGALGKKNIFSMLLGGFKNIYGVTGYLSDVLSYARLFGLGLATGVVAMVINQIASVIRMLLPGVVGAIFGWAISIVLYAVGHVFNIAINTLGTYVHNCRLQYVEFYGKFYTGGGHLFVPFCSDTKYVYVEKSETKATDKPSLEYNK